ncbi:MAG: DUF3658 domain-containing protein [Filifactoraceae bacterium]
MFEVCFSGSVKGSMIMAQSYGKRKEEVVCISLGLSEGDIKSSIYLNDCPRKEFIHSIFSIDRCYDSEYVDEFWESCINDLERLKQETEKIRIWLDDTADAQCGLLFLADLLKDRKIKLYIVKLPDEIKTDKNHIIKCRSWGEVDPKLYADLLKEENELTEKEIADLSERWNILQCENSQLRVFENDSIKSVDISYYDNIIREEFPKDACKIGYIIGSVLGREDVMTSDVFVAKRIQYFIDNEELCITDKNDFGFYGFTVKDNR